MRCDKHNKFYDLDVVEYCSECENEEDESDECEWCGGTGEVTFDVFDPDSGQYMRGVGTKRCTCQLE